MNKSPEMRQDEIKGVNVVRAGKIGPIIVYHHHAGQPPMGNAHHIMPLAEVGQVIAPDMYGLFAQARKDGIKDPTFADAMNKFFDLEIIDQNTRRFLVVAGSGGSLAWVDAAENQDAVAGIVAAGPTGWPINRSLPGWVYALGRDNIQKLGIPANLLKQDAGLDLLIADIKRYGPKIIWHTLTQLRKADARELFPQILAPVELLWSSRDYYVPLQGGREMANALPNARLRVVSRYNNLWHVFEPKPVIDAAIEQIRQAA